MSKNSGLGRGLGKGLGALLGDDANESESSAQTIDEISIELIDANPWQPRTEFKQDELEELAASIRNFGIITPLTLRKVEDSDRYQIIAGERRFRAAKIVGLDKVPAYVRDVSDDKMLAVALIENIQRADLNPIEEALSYQRLIDECQLTQETLADQVGKKRSTVTNYLRLLKLPTEIQDGLRDKVISMGHARAIMGLEDQDTQLMLYHETVEQGYSVRRIENLVRAYNETGSFEDPEDEADPNTNPDEQTQTADDLDQLESNKPKSQTPEEYKVLGNQLSQYFGTNVSLACNAKGKGKITIPFSTQDELERIMLILDAARSNNA
ncbi:MAG: ParB/RepB/Spo0J family partition protein [Marinilabiliaceae bacterium]